MAPWSSTQVYQCDAGGSRGDSLFIVAGYKLDDLIGTIKMLNHALHKQTMLLEINTLIHLQCKVPSCYLMSNEMLFDL